MSKGDYISGHAYRQVVHEITRECRSAQRLVSQLLTYSFIITLVAVTAIVALIWELLK